MRSEASEQVRVLIGIRERLIRMRKDLEAHVRGVLRTFGIRMEPSLRSRLRDTFRDQLAQAGGDEMAIGLMAEMFNPIHQALCAAVEAMDDELREIAGGSELARRLMTVPGVGPVVALACIATLDDASRFRRATDVGAFLGLTPRRHQSGDTDWSGRISKCGDRDLRRLLYSAATTLISQVRRFSPLRSRAIRLSARTGVKLAAVATARKRAVIMHRLRRDGTTFQWTREAHTEPIKPNARPSARAGPASSGTVADRASQSGRGDTHWSQPRERHSGRSAPDAIMKRQDRLRRDQDPAGASTQRP